MRKALGFVVGLILLLLLNLMLASYWPMSADVGDYARLTAGRGGAVLLVAAAAALLGFLVARIVGRTFAHAPAGAAAFLAAAFCGRGLLDEWGRSGQIDLVWFCITIVTPSSYLLAALLESRRLNGSH